MKVTGFSRFPERGGRSLPARHDSGEGFRWWRLSVLLGFAFVLHLSVAEPVSPQAAPFFRFRDLTLGYTGPEETFTNLTEVRIAWFGPTNLDDPLTGDLWWAANLAVSEANEQNERLRNAELEAPNSELGRLPFRLVPRWAVDPWGTGVSQLTRLIYDEHVVAVLGSVDSPSTHLAEQIVAKAQLPLISPIATDKSVTLAGVSWMFACAPTDDAIARVLVAEVLPTLSTPTNHLVLLAATDHESRMTVREVIKEFRRQGRTPDFRFDVPPGALDTARQLAAIAQRQPAAVLIVAGVEDAARLVSAVRAIAPASTLFGSHSMGRTRFLTLAGRAAEGVRFPLLFVPDATDPLAARFIERFRAERRRQPDYTAALVYDSTRLLLEAIRRSGLNRARIREAIPPLSPWTGVAGTIRWDGTGHNTRTNIGMGTVRNGAIVPLTPNGRLDTTTKAAAVE